MGELKLYESCKFGDQCINEVLLDSCRLTTWKKTTTCNKDVTKIKDQTKQVKAYIYRQNYH